VFTHKAFLNIPKEFKDKRTLLVYKFSRGAINTRMDLKMCRTVNSDGNTGKGKDAGAINIGSLQPEC